MRIIISETIILIESINQRNSLIQIWNFQNTLMSLILETITTKSKGWKKEQDFESWDRKQNTKDY